MEGLKAKISAREELKGKLNCGIEKQIVIETQIVIPEQKYRGSFDIEGLKELGYDDETIEWYNSFCKWTKDSNEYYKVNDVDKSLVGQINHTHGSAYNNKEKLRYCPWFDGALIPTATAYNFTYCNKMMTIPKFNVSKLRNLSNMFQFCRSLITIPQLDTAKLIGFSNCFDGCYSLITIPQISLESSVNCSYMFQNCYSLIEVPKLNTIKCTNMRYMFYYCYSLQRIKNIDTASNENFERMFYNCCSLTDIPVLDFAKATNLKYMFYGCNCLNDESLNNILLSCTTATAYTGTKTLNTIGLPSDKIAKCATLSNYQAFLDAGWSAS